MFFLKTPTMEVELIAILRHDHGYTVTIQDTDKGSKQLSIEDEDKVLDLLAELMTGRMNVYDDTATEINLTN